MKEINKPDTIVWVEMGRPIARYARNNFRLTSNLHPRIAQTLFTDQEFNNPGIRSISRDKIPKSNFTMRFEDLKRDWKFSQVYFWQGTTSRFFHLYDLMKHEKLENVLHLETDSVLLDYSFFQGLEERFHLAYPMQASHFGCASIMWIKHFSSLEPFLQLVLEKWEENDCDDMSLLGEYSERMAVLKLPTWPNHLGFNGTIFDAQSIGRYFLGTDSRNRRTPFSTRGLIDSREGSITEHLASHLSSWKIQHEGHKIVVTGNCSEGTFKMANIHFHGKGIPRSTFLLRKLLKISFEGKRGSLWQLGRFDFDVFCERTYSFVRRRILKKRSNTERIFR